MLNKPPYILVVDDNEDIRDLLRDVLTRQGYVVQGAKNAASALRKVKEKLPDLILLDVMMPDQDGIALCRELRTLFEDKTRIVFLTARNEEYSEVAGFEAGADDFISKPIKTRALVHRIATLLSRNKKTTEESNVLHIGDLIIDPARYDMQYKGKRIPLRRLEFELVYFLAQHPEHFFSMETLMNRIWGDDVQVTPRTVDVHIRRIREKIGSEHILTLKGVGYAFRI